MGPELESFESMNFGGDGVVGIVLLPTRSIKKLEPRKKGKKMGHPPIPRFSAAGQGCGVELRGHNFDGLSGDDDLNISIFEDPIGEFLKEVAERSQRWTSPSGESQSHHVTKESKGSHHDGESDPNGLDQHQPGAKLDAGKPRMSLVLHGFARALIEVGKVGTYGAKKYSDDGWMKVQDGKRRYSDALFRHLLEEGPIGVMAVDKDTGLSHAAHAAWNALARLELMLTEQNMCGPSGSCGS